MAKPPIALKSKAAPHALRQCGERNSGDQRPHRIGGDELPRQTFRYVQIARDRRKHARRHDLGQQRDKAAIANASRPPAATARCSRQAQISSFDSSITPHSKMFPPIADDVCIMLPTR